MTKPRYNFDTSTVAGRVIVQVARNPATDPPIWENWISVQRAATIEYKPAFQAAATNPDAGSFILSEGASSVTIAVTKKEQFYINGVENAATLPLFSNTLLTTVFTGSAGGAGGGGATAALQEDQLSELEYQSNYAALQFGETATQTGLLQNIRQSQGDINDVTDAGNLAGAATTNQLLRSIAKDQRRKNTGGIPRRIVAAAGINATVVKASPCEILGGQFNSRTTGTKQVKVYNWALSAPNPTTNLGALVWTGVVSGIGTIEIPPMPLSTGLSVVITAGATDTEATPVAANSCSLFLSHT